MSILGINPNDFEVKLGDTCSYISLSVFGHPQDPNASFMDHQKALDYIEDKKVELTKALNNLPAGIPKGPTIRKVIWEVLGIWVRVRNEGKLVFAKGKNLVKYYKIFAPSNATYSGDMSKDFEIIGRDGMVYTSVMLSIHYTATAPYDGYRF